MRIGARKVIVGASAVAWLVVAIWAAAGGHGTSLRAAALVSRPPTVKTASAVVGAACPVNGYTQTGAPAARTVRGGVETAAQGAPQPSGQQISDQAFKNVQLLKGIPVDEFMGTMGLFSAALGMCCLECHNEDWTFDTPRKRTARRMIAMTDTINKTNFNGRKVVTCWTCHRQSDRPAATPPLDVIYGEPVFWQPDDLFQQAQGAPKPDDVFDKYIQAAGGAQRLAAVTTIVAKGIGSGFGGSLRSPAELFAKAPNQRTTFIHTVDGDKTVTYDGTHGWLASNVTPVPVMDLTGGELDGARLDAELMFPTRIKQVLTQWRAALPMTINGRSMNVVQGTGKDLSATLYFDVQTGLLARVVRYSNSAMGRVPTQIDFDDYRDVSGVKLPYKWSFAWTSGRDLLEWSEVQTNASIDSAKFAKPKPAVSKIR